MCITGRLCPRSVLPAVAVCEGRYVHTMRASSFFFAHNICVCARGGCSEEVEIEFEEGRARPPSLAGGVHIFIVQFIWEARAGTRVDKNGDKARFGKLV